MKIRKISISFIVFAVTIIGSILLSEPVKAATYSGSCGTDVTWSLDTETGILEISGTGDMDDYGYPDYGPWYKYSKDIKIVKISEGISYIGNYSFHECNNLESVDIPESVTSLGYSIFSSCSSLKSIDIPESVTSLGTSIFSGCSNLESVVIPEGVVSIGNFAFSECSALETINIPEGVTKINMYAFSECSSLTSVVLPKNLTEICKEAFSGCKNLTSIEIPNKVTKIGDYVFQGCSSLVSIEIPNSVTSIGICAFGMCEDLKEVKLPAYMPYMSERLFAYCSSLTSIEIPSGVKRIDNYAFEYCKSLAHVEIPEGVESLGSGVFYRCTSLASIRLPESLNSFTFSRAFPKTTILYVIEGSEAHKSALNAGYTYEFITQEFDSPTLYFVIPKTVNSPKCWNNGIFLCYSNDYSTDSFTKLELTQTSRYFTPELKTESLIPGTYAMYSITLTEEQTEALNNATYVTIMNQSNTYRTYINGKGNILKAPVGADADSYRLTKTKIENLNGYTFVMNGEVQLGTSIQGYGTFTGYWTKCTDIKTVVPSASIWNNCWNQGVYLAYSNDYTTDSFTKIRMTKTDEYMVVESLTDQLVSGNYPIYTVSLTEEQVKEINGSTFVVFMNEGNGYRTYINGKYNVFKAVVDAYSDTYATIKAGVDDRANHTFIVCGGLDTNTSIEGYGTFTGYWKAYE